jgi:murein DD-endopeptidase MepM/ murein hydrolase activator NlpD
MRALGWLAVGGGVLVAGEWWRHHARATSDPLTSDTHGGPSAVTGEWVWPVPVWNGRAPVVSDGFDSPRPRLPRHGGVDIMFAREPHDPWTRGTPNGSKAFVMADDHPALAASDGKIWSAMKTPQGFAVVIDHGPRKVATFYAHIEKLLVPEAAPGKNGAIVRAGQPIGIIGASPLDAEHLKHLHFELWLPDPAHRVDPEPYLRTWNQLRDPREGGTTS